MRHHFVRLFLSILLISICVILVQCLFLFVGNWHVMRSWKNMVFEEFISSIASSMSSFEGEGRNDVMNLMISRTSERISGVLVRDKDGRFVLSLGASPSGVQMPSPEARRNMPLSLDSSSRLKLSYQNSISYMNIEIPPARYTLSVTTFPGTMVPESASLDETDDGEEMLVSLPSIVADQDIAGTIKVTINGETAGYLDVLVYRMDYYAPTMFAMKELLVAFLVSLPLALIVSALLAAAVSRWNEKSVKEIQDSLTDLSRGYFDVDLPKQNTEEMAEIADSITALGKDLSRHQRSRKEWIRNISHDLNTPVTSLNILISGALDGVFPLDRNLLMDMKNENDTLMQRIQSVAYYSYLLSPDVKIEKDSISVSGIIREAAEKDGIECSIDPIDTVIEADASLVSRAIHEVLMNAAAYGAAGDPPSASVAVRAGFTDITITNKGHLPDPLPQFFEPWARGDSSRTAGGSGLGLPIVYQIMELHSGSVMIWENDGIVSVRLSFPS